MARAFDSHTLSLKEFRDTRLELWPAALLAGFLASVAFYLWLILLFELQGQPPLATTRLIAALVLGDPAAGTPLGSDMALVAVAAASNCVLSFVYALLIAPVLHRLLKPGAVLVGVVFGLALYLVNFYVFAPLAFPWMESARGGIMFFGHLLFGGTLAYAYKLTQIGTRKAVEEPVAKHGDRE